MPKVAVILSGCGVYDGAEIHESVLTLLALDRAGADVICAAPNVDQAHVVDHLKGEPVEGEKRNVLVEAARIARGDIVDLATLSADDVDAAIFPGGFGAAKNLSDYAFKGEGAQVHSGVAEFIKAVHDAGKPLGFLCISPVVAAKVLGKGGHPTLTIGTDDATAGHIEAFGGGHEKCPTEGFVVDKGEKVVSTPAYMTGQSIGQVAEGIEKLVKEVVSLC
jgi:enhancing lycopene biosynthesis protein 2